MDAYTVENTLMFAQPCEAGTRCPHRHLECRRRVVVDLTTTDLRSPQLLAAACRGLEGRVAEGLAPIDVLAVADPPPRALVDAGLHAVVTWRLVDVKEI